MKENNFIFRVKAVSLNFDDIYLINLFIKSIKMFD